MIQQLTCGVVSELRSGVVLTSLGQCIEELVLNSVDAAASTVSIELDIATTTIEVNDNGSGIPEDDLRKLGGRYFTSKCGSLQDVNRGLKRYGFRGEALASLGQISERLDIISRHKTTYRTFCKRIHRGKDMGITECTDLRSKHGTTIYASGIFYRLPVRRKQISLVDFESIRQQVIAVALIQPEVSIVFRNKQNGTVYLQTRRSQSGILTQIFTCDQSKGFKTIAHTVEPFSITGYVNITGNLAKNLQFVYINKRLVLKTRLHKIANYILAKAMKQRDDNTSQRYPGFILNLSCPYNIYDITFDPRKTLVEFENWEIPVVCLTQCLEAYLTTEGLYGGFCPDSMVPPEVGNNDDGGKRNICASNVRWSLSSMVVKRTNVDTQSVAEAESQKDYRNNSYEVDLYKNAQRNDSMPDHRKKSSIKLMKRLSTPNPSLLTPLSGSSTNSIRERLGFKEESKEIICHDVSVRNRKLNLLRSFCKRKYDDALDFGPESTPYNDSTSVDGTNCEGTMTDGTSGDGTSFNGASGYGTSGDNGTSGDCTRGNGTSCDGTCFHGTSGVSSHGTMDDSTSNDGTSGDGASSGGGTSDDGTNGNGSNGCGSMCTYMVDTNSTDVVVGLSSKPGGGLSHGITTSGETTLPIYGDINQKTDDNNGWYCHYDRGRELYVNLRTGNTTFINPNSNKPLPMSTYSNNIKHKKCIQTLPFHQFTASHLSHNFTPWLPRHNDVEKHGCSGDGGGKINAMFQEWVNPVFERNSEDIFDSHFNENSHGKLLPINFTKDCFKGIKVIKQLENKFIVCVLNDAGKENKKVLVIIDQHAAHERVRLESFKKDMYCSDSSQPAYLRSSNLPTSFQLVFTKHEVCIMEAFRSQLEHLGLKFDEDKSTLYKQNDNRRVLIRAVPSVFLDHEQSGGKLLPQSLENNIENLIREQIEVLQPMKGAVGTVPQTMNRLLNSKACHGAIRFGDVLSLGDCEYLMKSLSKCDLPFQCAHGRPSMIPLVTLNVRQETKKKSPLQLWKLQGTKITKNKQGTKTNPTL